MPVYNCEDRVSFAIDSIMAQTFKNWELIIIDDGSNDKSGEVCERYSQVDRRITVKHITNSGVSFARNLGLHYSRGTYIEFIDSDDFLAENAMDKALNAIDDNDLLIFAYDLAKDSVICSIDCNDLIISSFEELKKEFITLDLKCLMNAPWNKIYKKEIIENNKITFPIDISLGEDLIFNLLYYKNCNKVKVISDVLYHCVDENMESLSRKKRKDYLQIQELLKRKVDECFDFDPQIVENTSKRFAKQVIDELKSYLRNKETGFIEKRKAILPWFKNSVFWESYNFVELNELGINQIDKFALKFHCINFWAFVYCVRNKLLKRG